MTNFNFYKADKAYGELYFQFPKVFLYSDKYKDLSNDAKIAYMVFKDRLQYSIRNNWIDENEYVYFIYTNTELCELLNCSEHKVIKIKKELEGKKLLMQLKQGFNAKLKRNAPNRLYLADLEVAAHEVYAFQNIEQSQSYQGTAKSAVRQDQSESQSYQGTAKNAVRQNQPESQSYQGTAKNAVNLYKDFPLKDTKENKDTNYASQNDLLKNSLSQTEHSAEEQNELIENLISEYNLIGSYGEGIIRKFKNYSNSNYEAFKIFVDKLYFSHKKAQSETDTPIYLDYYFTERADEYKEQLVTAFVKSVRKEKAGEIKTDFNNYLYGTFLNTFRSIGKRIEQERDPKHQDIPMVDWTQTTN